MVVDELIAICDSYSMLRRAKLRNLLSLATAVEQLGIKGDFVECGVWKGGSAGILGSVIKTHGNRRHLWLFDSFEGLPEPTAEDFGEQKIKTDRGQVVTRGDGKLDPIGKCVAAEDIVRHLLFDRLMLPKAGVHIVKGWFQETLPVAPIEKIALLHLDGDWYESTICVLQALYPKVQKGGYVIVDDYEYWSGCKGGTDKYRKEMDITEPLVRVKDSKAKTAVYWQVGVEWTL